MKGIVLDTDLSSHHIYYSRFLSGSAATQLKLGLSFSANNRTEFFCLLSYVYTIASSSPLPLKKGAKARPLKKTSTIIPKPTKETQTPHAFCIQTTQNKREAPYHSATTILHRAWLKIRRECRRVSQVPVLFTLPSPGHSISTYTSVWVQESQSLLQVGFEIKLNLLYISSVVHVVLPWTSVTLLDGCCLTVTPPGVSHCFPFSSCKKLMVHHS